MISLTHASLQPWSRSTVAARRSHFSLRPTWETCSIPASTRLGPFTPLHLLGMLFRPVREFLSRRRWRLYRPKWKAVVFMSNHKELCSTSMVSFYTCSTVGPIQLFISLVQFFGKRFSFPDHLNALFNDWKPTNFIYFCLFFLAVIVIIVLMPWQG